MANINVKDYGSVIADGTTIQQKAGKELQKVGSGEGIFDGSAATNVRNQVDSFLGQVQSFSEAVNSCGKFVVSAATTYQEQDAAAQSAFSGLSGN